MRIHAFDLIPVAAAALGVPAAAGSARLRIVDLGTLDGVCCSHAAAINDNGDVVGDSNVAAGPRHAFHWCDGRMTDLGTLGGYNSSAADINVDGAIVGSSELADGSTHAVLWREGAMIDLGTLGGDYSYAVAINDVGEVVGYSETVPGTSVLRGFSWHDGVMTELATLRLAHDISDGGAVVGVSVDGVPVLHRSGITTALTTHLGDATAINARGQVTGFTFEAPGSRSFLWSAGRLADLDVPGATFVQASAINDRDEVVGTTDFHAFLWRRGTMTMLPRLAGSTTGASGINNRGQIVGSSATTPEGLNHHAVLWTR